MKAQTVFVENTIRDRDGNIVKRMFIFYSSPTSPLMARSIADSLRRIGRSYRIAEEDGKGQIIDQWCREGWEPDDGFGKVQRKEIAV